MLDIKKLNNVKITNLNKNRYTIDSIDIFNKPMPAKYFILENINARLIHLVMRTLKNSIFWNIYGFILIVNTQIANSCKLAYFFLRVIWKHNILNSAFVCVDIEYKTQIYTFNPYSFTAPKPWKKWRSYNQENGHPFTLFANSYQTLGKSK